MKINIPQTRNFCQVLKLRTICFSGNKIMRANHENTPLHKIIIQQHIPLELNLIKKSSSLKYFNIYKISRIL